MTTVLAAMNSDACAQPVLGAATALADLLDATVVTLHVREDGAEIPARLAGADGVQLREAAGSPIEQIVAAARERDVAALVLGTRGARGGPRPAGHTALEIITRVAKPVVVVPPDARPPQRLTRILVPLDGTSESSRALADTIELAHRRRLQILVLHLHSPATVPAFSDHEPHATRAWDDEFLTRHVATPNDRVTLLRRLGVPADDVATVASETAVDLVVLAWSQRLGKGRARVVSETLARLSIPVLLLPVLPSHRSSNRRERLRRWPHANSAPARMPFAAPAD
ncbi:MAG TPA: universal stress protein [Gaiellaceae bacterium]|nr:universal stress protein [Gaiellaceae bacterium]